MEITFKKEERMKNENLKDNLVGILEGNNLPKKSYGCTILIVSVGTLCEIQSELSFIDANL